MFGVSEIDTIELVRPGKFCSEEYQSVGWVAAQPELIFSEWMAFSELLRSLGLNVREIDFGRHNPDQVFAYDAFVMTLEGAIQLRSGKRSRIGEGERRMLHQPEMNLYGTIEGDAQVDGGDVLWLSSKEVLIGHSWRTNRQGIHSLRALLDKIGVSSTVVDLPNMAGPSFCTHLMSFISMLDHQTALVAQPWINVALVKKLQGMGIRMIPAELEEWDYLCTNVLSLGDGRLIALAHSPRTNQLLAKSGFEVVEFVAPNLCLAGTGGPTCLCRPIPFT